jgi:hypothetical protein
MILAKKSKKTHFASNSHVNPPLAYYQIENASKMVFKKSPSAVIQPLTKADNSTP